MTEWILLGVGILLTIGTGFFVASEFSLVNLERTELEARNERGERGLNRVIKALKRTSTHLSSAQLGITLTTMLTGFLAEPSLSVLLREPLSGLGFSDDTTSAISLVLAMVLATLFSSVIGELVPKNLAIAVPLAVAKVVTPFQLLFTFTFGWAIWALNNSGNAIVRWLGIEPKEELSSSRSAEELTALVRRSATLGALDESTATLITRTLALSQLTAADAMTPRMRMQTITADASVQDLIQLSNRTGYSRFPVVDGTSDDVIGIAHVKQAASVPRERRAEVPATAIMIEPLRVPETMGLETLMVDLRSKSMQLAVVVDEYGGTAGLITLEDLVEELVGDLIDEHDRAKSGVTKGSNSSILFPGMIRPDELREMAIRVPADGAYETVAGFIMSALGKIPAVGDEVQIEQGVLRVERMDGRRVDRVRFTPTDLMIGDDSKSGEAGKSEEAK